MLITAVQARYQRTLARVRCVHCDGIDANTEKVRRAMAWVFERYAPKDSPLYRVQADAKAARRGLRADNAPVPPWEWLSGRSRPKAEADRFEKRPRNVADNRRDTAGEAGCGPSG